MSSSDTPPSGPPPGKSRRPLPTIDLEATEVETKPAASQAAAGPADPTIASSPDHFQAEANVSRDEEAKSADATPSDAPGQASPDWRTAMSGWRAAAGKTAGRLPSVPWRLIAAAVAGGVLVLAGFLVAGPGPERDNSGRVVDMRLIRVEQQIRELADRAPSATTDPKIVEELAGRLAKLETALAAIRPSATDPALANRIATIEGGVKAMAETVSVLGRRNDEIAALAGEARKRADANAAAIAEFAKKIAALGPSPVVRSEFDALGTRLAAVERSEKAIEAELAKRPLDAPPDRAGRLAVLAAALKGAVDRGEAFGSELASVKALAPDAKALTPLEPFAASGVPTTVALARELSVLLPSLYQAAGVSQRESGGFLERLQANAEKLVRIRPTEETPGTDPTSVITRIEVKAAHNDVAGALAELIKLPANVRSPAEAWIKQAEARSAAVEASRKFAADAMAALGK